MSAGVRGAGGDGAAAPASVSERPSKGRAGTLINGKWTLEERIGTGGMATVYAATHRNGHRAAVKMLHAQLSRDASTRARFLREGRVANAVSHPGVVSVLDDGVAEDGCAYLVLELLEGETIDARRLRMGGSLPVEEVLELADQALEALAAAHEKGIVHRDVKPENVFLTNDGRIKLLDFGLARMKDTAAEATKTGVTIGTPEFMPPEQAMGRRDSVDARSDVWGLGATLFQLLAGRYVHDASSLHEQLIASATRRPQPLRQVAPHVPASVAQVIDRALELEMSDRWQSALEMRDALRAARPRPGGRPVPRKLEDASDMEETFVEERRPSPRAAPGHDHEKRRDGANRDLGVARPRRLDSAPPSLGGVTPTADFTPARAKKVRPRGGEDALTLRHSPHADDGPDDAVTINAIAPRTGGYPSDDTHQSDAMSTIASPKRKAFGEDDANIATMASPRALRGTPAEEAATIAAPSPRISMPAPSPRVGPATPRSRPPPSPRFGTDDAHAATVASLRPGYDVIPTLASNGTPGFVSETPRSRPPGPYGGSRPPPAMGSAPPPAMPSAPPPSRQAPPKGSRQARTVPVGGLTAPPAQSSARAVIIVSLILIFVCAAMGAYVLSRGTVPVQ